MTNPRPTRILYEGSAVRCRVKNWRISIDRIEQLTGGVMRYYLKGKLQAVTVGDAMVVLDVPDEKP